MSSQRFIFKHFLTNFFRQNAQDSYKIHVTFDIYFEEKLSYDIVEDILSSLEENPRVGEYTVGKIENIIPTEGNIRLDVFSRNTLFPNLLIFPPIFYLNLIIFSKLNYYFENFIVSRSKTETHDKTKKNKTIEIEVFECEDGYFKCQTVDECVLEESRCDQEYDCSDNSDEFGCPPGAPQCSFTY